jgi:hypothetical protein
MPNQKLFEALQRLCGFTVLQSDMFEIIRAVEADKIPMTETIEQAAERYAKEYFESYSFPEVIMTVFKDGAFHQLSQPNPNRITDAHVRQLHYVWFNDEITLSRMVEILNEIAAGKHKERI